METVPKDNEVTYQLTMHAALLAYRVGIISEEEYKQFDTMMHKKYAPIFGTLLYDIDLINHRKYGNI